MYEVLLRQQYRMHPGINSFPSQQFYGGKVGMYMYVYSYYIGNNMYMI